MFVARVNPHTSVREGDRVFLVADTKRLQFFDPSTGPAILGGGDRLPTAVYA